MSNEFGEVVDAIESRQFQPPSLEKLKGKLAGKKVTFAVQVCRNCDARFSCSAYRRYVKSSSSQADSLLSRFLNDYGSDSEREDFLYGNLENIPDIERFDIVVEEGKQPKQGKFTDKALQLALSTQKNNRQNNPTKTNS